MGKRVVTPKVVVKENAPVVPQLMSVVQKKGTEFEATMNMAVSSAAVSNFNVVEKDSNRIVAVNTVAVDKTDATKVTFTTYESLTNGKVYTVTYTADNEAKTESSYEFTATDGTIDSLNLTPLTITAGKATTIKYQTLDKTGVILSEKSIGSPETGIEVTTTYNDGYYTSSGDLYLGNKDDIATIVVSYHTYKYEGATETGAFEKTFTVKAVDSASVASYDYTIAKDKPFNWATVKQNTQIAMEDTDYKAFIRIVDANGDALNDAQASEYSVTSSNDNVLLAAGTVDGAIELTPVAQGTAYLVVSKDGKNVTSLQVTVGAKRVLTSVKLDQTSVTVATDTAVGLSGDYEHIGNAEINVKYFDQYSVEMTGTDVTMADPASTSKPLGAVSQVNAAKVDDAKIRVDATAAPSGTYGYKVTGTDKYGNQKSAVFSVRVVKPGTSSTIKLAVANKALWGTVKDIDTTVKAGSVSEQTIIVRPVGVGASNTIVSGAPLSSTVSVSAIKVTGSDGVTYAATGAGVTVTSQAITTPDGALGVAGELEIKVREDGSSTQKIRKYLPAGTYTISYTITDKSGTTTVKKTYNTQFTVKDEQPKTTVKVVEPNIGSESDIKTALTNSKYAVFSYDGIALTNADGDSSVSNIKVVVGSKTTSGTRATIDSVVAAIPVKIGGTDYTIDTVVPVKLAFSGTANAFDSVQGKDALKLY